MKLINEELLPFDLSEVEKSNSWNKATFEEKEKFISAVTTITTLVNMYEDKYWKKHTLKAEFTAMVLCDWWHDLVEAALNCLDDELEHWYDGNLNEFSERLLDECVNSEKWIKTLKKAYRENKLDIKEAVFDKEKGAYDLELVNDISDKYRDYLY